MLRKLTFSILFLLTAFTVPAAAGEEADADQEQEERETFTAEDIPAPIADAQVGDWAQYTRANGSTSRLTVVERWSEHGDDHLIIENLITSGKKRRRERVASEDVVSVKERVADARDLGPNDFITRSEVLVAGRKLNVLVVHYHEGGELVRQSYFSDRVPIYGLVRGIAIEGNKKTVVLNLKEYGFADDDE